MGAPKMEVSFPGVFSAKFLLPEKEGCVTTILWQAECARKRKKLGHRVTSTCRCLGMPSALKGAKPESRRGEKRSGIGPHQEHPLLGPL